MDRRSFIRGSAAAVGAAALDGPAIRSVAASAVQPNILFVMVDELRFPSVFPTGIANADAYFQTFMPNLHDLSRRGASFTNHFSAASACTPARGTLLTGLYSHQTWVCLTLTQKPYCTSGLQPALQTAFPTWGKLLQNEGYDTAWCGKWHLSYPSSGTDGLADYGFAEQLVYPDPTGAALQGTYGEPSAGYLNDQNISNAATGWLAKRTTGEKPWCLAVSFVNPHDQEAFWGGTEFETYDSLFASSSLAALKTYGDADNPPVVPWAEDALKAPPSYGYPTVPPNWESGSALASKPTTQLAFRNFSEADWGGITDDPSQTSYRVVPYPGVTPAQIGIGQAPFRYWQKALDCYTYLCTQVDNRIGEVLAALPADVAANTVIVFTADHGEYAGAHGFVAGKLGTAYDEVYHVPLMVVDPTGRYVSDVGVPRTGLSSSVDMLPMLLGIATGGQSWMSGDSKLLYGNRLDMLPMLKSAQAPGRTCVTFATDETMPAYYNPGNAPLHVTGLRTATAKLATYAHWQIGTTAPEPVGHMQLEYYDYSTRRGRLELDSTPNTSDAQALLDSLYTTVIATELQAPLPTSLLAAQEAAKLELLAVYAIAAASSSPSPPTTPSSGSCMVSMDTAPGADF